MRARQLFGHRDLPGAAAGSYAVHRHPSALRMHGYAGGIVSHSSIVSPARLRLGVARPISAALLLVASTVLAPFSLPQAAYAEGQSVSATNDLQMLAAADAESSVTDLDLSLEVEEAPKVPVAPAAEYTLEQFMFTGSVNWGGYRFTYYSQQVLPGGGLAISGRHVNAGGYVSDGDGFIVLAGSAPKGTVFETPFGYPGKIYDRGTVGNHLDVYIR